MKLKAFDYKLLNQTGWTNLWIQTRDAMPSHEDMSYNRMITVGYGYGPNFPYPAPTFWRQIYLSPYTNATEKNIKYIGLHCTYGSFEYEILNGKLSIIDQWSMTISFF